MASNFWIGASVSVTANSKLVTVLSSSDDITKIKEGAAFVASNYSIPFEVNRTYNDGSNDIIELKENWTGATSASVSATVVVGPGAIASTREAIVNLISAYEAFEALVTPTVTANGLAQRTATGQLKTANAVNNDEAVAKGQVDGLTDTFISQYGVGENALPAFTDWNAIPYPFNGILRIQTGAVNAPSDLPTNFYYNAISLGNSGGHLLVIPLTNNQEMYLVRRTDATTFTLIGNIFGYLDHGIGAEFGAAWPNGTDLNNTTGVRPGVYKIYAATPTEALGFPPEYSANANVTIIFNIEASTRMTMILSDAKTGETFVRAYNGSWKPYRKLYDSTNSANPLDFGFCVPADANAPVITATQADTTMLPTSAGRGQLDNGIFTTFINLRANLNRQAQFHMAYGGGEPRAFARMMVGDFQWSDIIEFYTDHNSANPLDYGIGGVKTLSSGYDILSLSENGLYYLTSPTNKPDSPNANWVVLVNTTNNPLYKTIKAWSVGKVNGVFNEYTNTMENGVWSGWRTVYDSGNINFNAFGTNTAGRVIANGNANTTTTVRMEFNLVSKTVPTSITITSPSDFEVRTVAGAIVGTVSAISMLSISSERVGMVEVTITGGSFDVDKKYQLRNLNTNGLVFNF